MCQNCEIAGREVSQFGISYLPILPVRNTRTEWTALSQTGRHSASLIENGSNIYICLVKTQEGAYLERKGV